MAAVIVPESLSAPWHRPDVARPRLRVIPGGASAARARRRHERGLRLPVVLAGVALALLAALALVGGAHVVGAGTAAFGPVSSAASPTLFAEPVAPPVAPPVAEPALTPVASSPVIVRPGDTLWSIARSLHPSGDIRTLVDRLAERVGGIELSPGQRIDVAGLR